MDVDSLVHEAPAPIVDSKHKVVLVWSAKSGCTFAIKWLLDHMGLLEEALAFHRWIHYYRVQKLYKSAEYEAGVKEFCYSPESYRLVRFVRNPFTRAVSSYVHAATCGYEDAKIARFMGRRIDDTSRYSYREFVSYLETLDLQACDVHHRVQTHPLERVDMAGSSFMVDLEHSMQSLPRLERFLGLPPKNSRRYRVSHHHTKPSSTSAGEFSADVSFDILHKPRDALPGYRDFYDQELEERVYGLYAEDFLRYGFSTNLATLGP